jgi:hypothetical protein
MRKLMIPIKNEQNRLRMNKQKSWKPRLVLTLGNHCLSEDTEVYVVGKGWIFYSEIEIGDSVYTINTEGQYKIQPILDIIIRDAIENEVYVSDTTTSSVAMTGGHRVYYKTCTGKLKVKLAKDFNCAFNMLTSANNYNMSVPLSNDELKLAAWLCTDSCFTEHSISLYQRESNANSIEFLLDRLNIQYSKSVRQRNITSICGKQLKTEPEREVSFRFSAATKRQLEDKLKVYSNKVLPAWVTQLTNTQWNIFLETLIEADGSIPTRATLSRVFYGKRQICEDVQFQAHLHGWRASITEYRKGQFRVNLTQRDTVRTELKKIPYIGKVWCISVSNKNFMIRRNNKVCFTGNCERINRAIETDRKLEGLISVKDLEYEDWGWEVYPYLQPVEVSGISFCHYFVSGVMGRPVTSAKMLLTKHHMSCVAGHQQGRDIAYGSRPNGDRLLGLISGSCYLDDESYLNPQTNDCWHGIWMLHEVTERGSCDEMPVSLDYLRNKYGG